MNLLTLFEQPYCPDKTWITWTYELTIINIIVQATTDPQHIHNISSTYPQHIHNISSTYPQHIRNISTIYPQHIHNISTTYPQHIHNISTTDSYRHNAKAKTNSLKRRFNCQMKKGKQFRGYCFSYDVHPWHDT